MLMQGNVDVGSQPASESSLARSWNVAYVVLRTRFRSVCVLSETWKLVQLLLLLVANSSSSR
jgi:hypothetical protein